MKYITLDNWKEEFRSIFATETTNSRDTKPRFTVYTQDTDEDEHSMEGFIDQLLSLQKQALKDEAVKRIEEGKASNDHSPEMTAARCIAFSDGIMKTYDQALSHAQDIIRNL